MASGDVNSLSVATGMQVLNEELELKQRFDNLSVEFNENTKTKSEKLNQDIKNIEEKDLDDEQKVSEIEITINAAEAESWFPLRFSQLFKSQEPSIPLKANVVLCDKIGISLNTRVLQAFEELIDIFNKTNPVHGQYDLEKEVDNIYTFILLCVYLTNVDPECIEHYFSGKFSIFFSSSGKLRAQPIWVAANNEKTNFAKDIQKLNQQRCCQVRQDRASQICPAIQKVETKVCKAIKLDKVELQIEQNLGADLAEQATGLLNTTLTKKVTLKRGTAIHIAPDKLNSVQKINAFLQEVAKATTVTPEMLQRLVDVNLVCKFCTKKLEVQTNKLEVQKSAESEKLEGPQALKNLAEAQNLEFQSMLKDNIQGLVMQLVTEKGLPLEFKNFEIPRWQ